MAVKNRNPRERTLYPVVARWLTKQRKYFKTEINAGLKHSRIDVIGVRDVGGDLSGEIETFSVEVKRGSAPFAAATGQALGYRVYANRIYLADLRSRPFSQEEIEIAKEGHGPRYIDSWIVRLFMVFMVARSRAA